MTTEEEGGWRSLSQRDVSTHEDTLFEGVPDHLMPSLIRWITGYLDNHPDLTQRVALRMRIPLDTPDPQQLVESVRASDSARVLDVADMAIHLDQRLRWDLDVAGPEIIDSRPVLRTGSRTTGGRRTVRPRKLNSSIRCLRMPGQRSRSIGFNGA